jgi:chaperonin GroEL (HSP60 family)
MNPRDISLGIELASRAVDADLVRRARPCKDARTLAHVAALAAGGDENIGALVADALEKAASFRSKWEAASSTRLKSPKGCAGNRGIARPIS